MDTSSFANTRVRCQRLKDAKIFSGWIRRLGAGAAIVHLRKAKDVEPGDLFAFEACGPQAIAHFRGQVQVCHGQELSMQVTSQITFVHSHEEMRLLVEGMAGLIIVGGVEHDMTLVDLSCSGAAIVCNALVDKGEKVELVFDSPQGQVICDGEVVYCTESGGQTDGFRVGLTVKPQNRIDTARWQRLLKSAA